LCPTAEEATLKRAREREIERLHNVSYTDRI
jgi:hypothetical protein